MKTSTFIFLSSARREKATMGTFDGMTPKKPGGAMAQAVVHKVKVWWKRRSTKEKTGYCGVAALLVTPRCPLSQGS
jgi:hypothetical protein